VTLTRTPAAAHRFDPDRLRRIDEHLAAYVDDGSLAGWELAITQDDQVVHRGHYGRRDRATGRPVDGSTVWRIASMTKPVTAVAALALWEQGAFSLDDPVSRWIPAFADARVYVSGDAADPQTVPAKEPMRVRHLLSHTSGMSAGFLRLDVVDQIYREAGFEWGSPDGPTLEMCVDRWARLPWRFEPGSAWGYGVSSDVLGRLVEIWTGQRLDDAFRSLVTAPLAMDDTRFWAGPDQQDRLPRFAVGAPLGGEGPSVDWDAMGRTEPTVFSGGGGLIGTVADYTRFTRMLACEGTFDGTTVLKPETVRLMRTNQLGGDLTQQRTEDFAEAALDGVGFGLGVACVVDPVRDRGGPGQGEFFWGGVFGTLFWVDPVTRTSCIFMAQQLPPTGHPIRAELRELVYGALLD
jgi:CubicO group peptidase (beta-lactamase class C family)